MQTRPRVGVSSRNAPAKSHLASTPEGSVASSTWGVNFSSFSERSSHSTLPVAASNEQPNSSQAAPCGTMKSRSWCSHPSVEPVKYGTFGQAPILLPSGP